MGSAVVPACVGRETTLMAPSITEAQGGLDERVRRGSKKFSLSGRGGDKMGELESPDETSADNLLEAMGYQPELNRNRSTLQVAFMSFVLASIPYGLATTFYYPLAGGGPTNIIWGWFAVSCIIFCVAISLGEITSVYPTAGGVYYQTFMLSPPRFRRIASWICGWAYVVGNITITLAVQFGTTLFFVACINVFESEPGVGIWEAETYQVFLTFLGITLLCNAISALGNRWLPILDTFAIFWTFSGLIAIIVCVLAIAKNGRHSGDYVFTHFEANSGWVPGWSFCVGLLHAAYATSSTGMIISMCEEVRQPSTQVPKAMVGTIVLNTLAGLLFLIPLVFVLPDIQELIALPSGQPVPTIIKSAVGSSGGAFGLLIPLLGLAIICGVACTTAASRCTWAFARDGAIPGSKWWKQVNQTLDVPLNAMMLSMTVQILLGVIYFGSAAAFNAFSGVGVICLTVSYASPIAVSLLGGRKHIKTGNFDMGIFGAFANVVAIAWTLLAVPLFSMPSYIPVEASTMNYASVVFVGFVVISTAWYIIWGHKHYQGPPAQEEDIIEHRMSVSSGHHH
ncbi:amino acid permease-domain-containing protein [Lineolata rhizophorae]|uniref:Amino acid permease-domain-containing protein n=1 Tax=Lineolata rhizophorae TaxID=578093 RepID=A0A6A6P178_9PEZI|nr:amino acid permease-domain-containing protein [Lineolata rhizophorae]